MQHIPISLVFACGIDGEKRGLEGFPQKAILNPEGQDTNYNIREIGDSLYILDAIVISRSQSPPYEYIEGGNFRNPLTTINRWQAQLVQQMLIAHNLAIQIIDLGRREKASYLEVGILMALSVCPYN
ncbi:hypothetical protein [Nostoc favosum]|uniref:Transposase n=1 Tax=Nostoc favosum CHAB5714 TaxID=2780399 RepID=A0ABS8I2D7_9NOSO|nr:hypothetical protein [Nostoc favosum]MCC5598362.1 hypothetical protein [Nostoc favosum CHAB5714]